MFSVKRAALGVLLILITLLIGVLAWTSYHSALPNTEQIPQITLQQFEEKLNGLRGKPVVLNFWASWCLPCIMEAKDLERTYQEYKGEVEFIGINIKDDTVEKALKFLEEFGVTFPQVRDNTNQIAIYYKITGIPNTFLITKEGEIVKQIFGATTEAALSKAIEEELFK